MDKIQEKIFIFDQELKELFNKKSNKNIIIQELFTVSQEAIERGMLALKEGRILELDPLVGDTACQTRAPEIPAIYRCYLKEKDLNISEKKFIGLCYFLCCSTKVNEKGLRRTDHKKIGDVFNVSKKRTDHMVRSAQRMLATLSVEVIERIAQGLQTDTLVKEVLKERCRKIDKFHRPLLPCFFTALAALRHEKEAGRPIQLIVEGSQEKRVFILPKEQQPLEVMVTVEGMTKYPSFELFEKGLNEHGLEELVLMCGAMHAQYGSSDVKDQVIPVEEAMKLLEEKREKAKRFEGLFMVQHFRAREFVKQERSSETNFN